MTLLPVKLFVSLYSTLIYQILALIEAEKREFRPADYLSQFPIPSAFEFNVG